MQSVSSRIWTRVAVSISYDDNDYTTGTPTFRQGGEHKQIKCLSSRKEIQVYDRMMQ